MDISGTTRVFMVLADPVAQVKAPQIFNPLFRRHGVDAVLVPAHVRPAHFEPFVRHVLGAGNIDGLWLTIPHKTAAVALLDRIDRHGRIAQAVNAMRRNADGTIEGGLFDGTGFVAALRHQGFEPCGRRALVVGVGGAGVAIAAALAEAGVSSLSLFDRSAERAQQVAALVAKHHPLHPATPASADPAGFDLVVNATPLGLQPGDPLPFDVARLEADATVADILMKREATPLLRACAERGIRAHAGFEMLVQQTPDYLEFMGLGDLAATVRSDLADVRRLLMQV